MVKKLSEIQFTNMRDDTVSVSIIICGIQLKTQAKIPTLNLKPNYVRKMLVSLNVHAMFRKTFHFSK